MNKRQWQSRLCWGEKSEDEGGMSHMAKIFSEKEIKENDNQRVQKRVMT